MTDKLIFDEKIEILFKDKVRQVFVYLTKKCQLRCRHCLYKTLLDNDAEDIDFNLLEQYFKYLSTLGAYKISFLGGEPTLYHDLKNGKRLTDVLTLAAETGYEYIRIDTNGQFNQSYLEDPAFKKISEITFSLDGHDEYTNDVLRGQGVFKKSIENIKYALSLGFRVHFTSCIHKDSCPDLETGIKNLNKMIQLAEDLGINTINFHPIIKVGVKRDTWIEDTDIDPFVWMQIYDILSKDVYSGRSSLKVRLPMRFVNSDKYDSSTDSFDYCPVKLRERALILTDGSLKICAFHIGTKTGIAELQGNYLKLNDNAYNEYQKSAEYKKARGYCWVQQIRARQSEIVPLCMSYKPGQDELVWNDLYERRC